MFRGRHIIPADARKLEGARRAAIKSHFIKNIFKGVEFDQFRKTEVRGDGNNNDKLKF